MEFSATKSNNKELGRSLPNRIIKPKEASRPSPDYVPHEQGKGIPGRSAEIGTVNSNLGKLPKGKRIY